MAAATAAAIAAASEKAEVEVAESNRREGSGARDRGGLGEEAE